MVCTNLYKCVDNGCLSLFIYSNEWMNRQKKEFFSIQSFDHPLFLFHVHLLIHLVHLISSTSVPEQVWVEMRLCWYDGGKAILAMVLVQAIYVALNIFAHQAFREGFNVMVFVVYKQGLAFLVLFPSAILLNRGKINHLAALGVKGFSWVFVTAVFCTTLTQFCYYQGLNLLSPSMATAMLNLVPGVTFLFSLLLGFEKLNLKSLRSIAKISGTLICIAGAMCMAFYRGSPILQSSKQNFMLGCIFLFATVSGMSFNLILQGIICKHYLDPLSLSVWLSFLATISSAILTLIIDGNLNGWKIRTQTQLIACLFGVKYSDLLQYQKQKGKGLLLLRIEKKNNLLIELHIIQGIIETAVTYYLLAWTIATRGPLFPAVFNPLTTVLTTTFTFLVLHQNLYIGSLVGAVVVIFGLYMVLWGKAVDYETKTKVDQRDDSIEQVDGQSDLHEHLVSGTRAVDV